MTEKEHQLMNKFEMSLSKLTTELQESDSDIVANKFIKRYWQPVLYKMTDDIEINKRLLNKLSMMQKNFEINKKFLSTYPFILDKNFIPPKENRYLLILINDEFAYRFDTQQKIFDRLRIKSKRETKYFFENLDKPLLLNEEYNQFNLEFLSDVVRDSKDFAGDNHIYIRYRSMNEFSLLMYYVDMSKICRDEKFVFLINGGG